MARREERCAAALGVHFRTAAAGCECSQKHAPLHVSPDGVWYLDSLETYAEGRLLFFERVFRLHMVFSDYFPYAAADKPGTSH